MSPRYDLAALYIDPLGHYPWLVVDAWDEARDARRYSGPRPVIAHPPCAPWSRLHAFSSGAGKDCGPIAVEQVRCFGGVLEHPADSGLWDYMQLPRADSWIVDEWGGRSYLVSQGQYGHRAPKLTWLYAVRLGPCPFRSPTQLVGDGRVALMGAPERRRTPLPFAVALCEWVSHLVVRG